MGGSSNTIGCATGNCPVAYSGIFGGEINSIKDDADTGNPCYNAILGGYYNCLNALNCFSLIAGSCNVRLTTNTCFSVALGLQTVTNVANCTICVGNLVKAAGKFSIPHPNPAKKCIMLNHSFVETPTQGDNIYKYRVQTANCQASVMLPDYYKFLNCNDQVHVSPVDTFGNAYGVIDSCQTSISIFTTEEGKYDLILIGTRKDEDAKNTRIANLGAEQIIFK
jgi:hypothetical protein